MSLLNLNKNVFTKLSIILSLVCFFAINIISNNSLKNFTIDVTSSKLYSVSDGTKNLISNLKEPIHLRLFMSSNLVKLAPQLSTYANRVESVLNAYANMSNGKITLELIDPKPFSDQEDRAVGMGISPFGGSSSNDPVYFGLAATNSTT